MQHVKAALFSLVTFPQGRIVPGSKSMSILGLASMVVTLFALNTTASFELVARL